MENSNETASEEMQVDLLVIGAGIAGLTAAAYAARNGLTVLVVEKAAEIGGSSALSAGGLAKPASYELFRQVNPSGDPTLAKLLLETYDDVIAWIDSFGVAVTPPADVESTLGFNATIRGIDIVSYLARCRTEVEGTVDCFVVTESTVERLLVDNGRVVGGIVASRDGATTVKAKWTLIATGGFQNDAELRTKYIGEHARNMLVRSNPVSAGDGLRLGQSVGAATTDYMDRFYGHTIPAPLNHEYLPRDYVRLAQFYLNTRCLILDSDGHRFTDESAGYYENARRVSLQPRSRALLVGDQSIRDEDAAGGVVSGTLGYERLDRIPEAAKSGANVAEAATLEELEALVAPWGYRNIARTVREYNKAIEGNAELNPPRARNRRSIAAAPFFAMEIQPAISFPFGGLRIDGQTHVLGRDGIPIPGLLGAGSDIGGAYHERYSGGLIMAGVQGLQAARTVIADRI